MHKQKGVEAKSAAEKDEHGNRDNRSLENCQAKSLPKFGGIL